MFFLDVALLFEMGWDIYCDCIILADVDYDVQRKRVMERDKITAEDFDKINDIQMSNKDKALLSDIVVNTDKPRNQLKLDLIGIVEGLENSW